MIGNIDPAAVPVGEGADHDPPERTDQHRHRHQQRDVRLAQGTKCSRVSEHRAERADQGPGPEVHREYRPWRWSASARVSRCLASPEPQHPAVSCHPQWPRGTPSSHRLPERDALPPWQRSGIPSQSAEPYLGQASGPVAPDSSRMASAVPETSVLGRPGPKARPSCDERRATQTGRSKGSGAAAGISGGGVSSTCSSGSHASQDGRYQFHRPRAVTAAGTMTIRMNVASTRMASTRSETATPKPICWNITSPPAATL